MFKKYCSGYNLENELWMARVKTGSQVEDSAGEAPG